MSCCGFTQTKLTDLSIAKYVVLKGGRRYNFHPKDIKNVMQHGDSLVIFLPTRKFTYRLEDIKDTNLI